MKKNSIATFLPQNVINRTINKPTIQPSKNTSMDSQKIALDKTFQNQNMILSQRDIQSKQSNLVENNDDVNKKTNISRRLQSNNINREEISYDGNNQLLYLRQLIQNEIEERKNNEKQLKKKLTKSNQQFILKCQELKEFKELYLQRQKNFNIGIDQLKKDIYQTIDQNIIDMCRKQHNAYKNQMNLQIGQLKQSFGHLVGQIKQWVVELQNKPSFNQISQAFNELKQKISIASKGNQQAYNIICELKDQNESIINKIKEMQTVLMKYKNSVDQSQNQTKQIIDQAIENLEDDIQDKLTKIISSYNLNFAQIQENAIQLKEMVSEILNINSMLSQKLINLVTNKLDSMTFQSTIQNLNTKIHQTVDMNNKKIDQIGQKQFEFEHELRSLKDILDNLKLDYEKNHNKIKAQENKSMIDSDVKSNFQQSRILKENFPVVLSPKNYDINYDFVRFKRNQEKDPIRKSGIQRIKKQKKYRGDDEENKVQHNNLANELAELGF